MRSTGEVMGFDTDFGAAFAKSQTAAFGGLPVERTGLRLGGQPRQAAHDLPDQAAGRPGFEILATAGTAEVLRRNGVPATVVRKHSAGPGPDGEPTIVGRILAGEVDLVINTPHGTTSGGSPRLDGYEIRTASVATNIPCITTVQGPGRRGAGHRGAPQRATLGVRSLQSWSRREPDPDGAE